MLVQQVLGCRTGRRIVPPGQQSDDTAVGFFRPGMLHVAGAKPGLDMAHPDPLVKAGQCAGHGGSGVALHQHHIRFLLLEDALKRQHQGGGQPFQRLPGRHDVQIDVRGDAKNRHYSFRHGAVLTGKADNRREAGRIPESQDDRRHLYCFRTRSVQNKYTQINNSSFHGRGEVSVRLIDRVNGRSGTQVSTDGVSNYIPEAVLRQ